MRNAVSAFARVAIGAALMAVVALTMGTLGYLVARGTDQSFANPAEAAWRAFLRLIDFGYLGDDEGTGLRVVSSPLSASNISQVYRESLTHGLGNELFARRCGPDLAGRSFWQVTTASAAAAEKDGTVDPCADGLMLNPRPRLRLDRLPPRPRRRVAE